MKLLKVLLIEDSEDDALILLRHLKRNGYAVEYERIQDGDSMKKILHSNGWELIISDYSMPNFDGLHAISILKESGIDIPFIMISGTIGEEVAVQAMLAGADDYFIKGNIERLCPAIERTLKEAENRRARRRAEKDLAESKKRLQLALNAVGLGVWEWNLVTNSVYWSPESYRIFGTDIFNQEINGFFSFVYQDDLQRVKHELFQAIEKRRIFRSEFRIVKNTGEIVWMANFALTEYDEDRKPLRMIGTVQDITERKNAEENLQQSEEKLRQAQKLESIGRLAGGIAHDFNNMLTVIKGYGDLSLRLLSEDHPVRKYVEEIKRAGERSSSLTYQLLAFSRTQILKPEILNINQIISETIKMTRYMIGEDIQIILHLDSEIGFIKADPGQISQVLMNLLVNARDAMFEGGAINIKTQKLFLDEKQLPQDSAEKKGDYICLNVIDTGIGMDEKTLQNIFEPFFTTKDVGKGTGLGLATVYGIVEQSGGFINVESELGIGTTFKIFLPSVKEKPKIEDGDLQKEPARGKGTILIVEDEILVRNLTRDALRENGYDVIEAANGAEAFNLFEKKKIIVDLLITDIVMPRMSGYELVAKLKDHKPPLKVLFTSGYLEDERIKNASFDISHNFIQKPFQLKDLMLKIQEILASEDNHY